MAWYTGIAQTIAKAAVDELINRGGELADKIAPKLQQLWQADGKAISAAALTDIKAAGEAIGEGAVKQVTVDVDTLAAQITNGIKGLLPAWLLHRVPPTQLMYREPEDGQQ